MATINAQILDEFLATPFAGLTTNLLTPAQVWRLPYLTRDITGDKQAVRTDTAPVDEPGLNVGANIFDGFVADYYYRIHILPAAINFGAIIGTQTRSVEVWNAYFDSRAFTSLEVSNPSGTTLAPLGATAPSTLEGLQSLKYTLTVSTSGPATVGARYSFTFDVGTFYLDVTGQRTAIFSFPPNWAESYIERLSWLTGVLTSANGKEQRIARRLVPRRSFEYTVSQVQDDYQYLDSLLVGWQARIYAFPIWNDAQYLNGDVASGSIEALIDTADRDFRVGGYVILTTGPRKSEAAEIAEIQADRVIFTKPVDQYWPAASLTPTRIMPARLGRLQMEVEATRPTARIGQVRVAFEVEDITNETPVAESSAYMGKELVLRKPNRAEDVSVKYSRVQDRVDYEEGVIAVEDRGGRAFTTRSYEYVMPDRADIRKFRQWLHVRQGQLKPFWAPVWECNVDIVGVTNAIDTSLIVRAQGYSSLLSIDDSRRHLAIRHKSGTWYYRQILQFTEGDTDDTEVIYLASAIGVTTVVGDFTFATFMDYMVLNTDNVELTYIKDDVATARISQRSVIQ